MLSDPAWLVVVALALDALIGDPDLVWRRWPHPVTWLGLFVGALDHALNREAWSPPLRRTAGLVALIALVAAAAAAGWIVDAGLRRLPFGEWIIAAIASVFIAQRSLYDHVRRVGTAFVDGGLASARRAVAMIVGRDPDSLDEAGVCRAAIESCAENFSDGVVAPVFWLAIFGLPGVVVYKAINTADSMIGHRTARHEAFGWAAARCDDLVNLVPARLAGVMIALVAPLVGGSPAAALRAMWREAPSHRSPNAGWPESAMAATLGVALAGPRRYRGQAVSDPYLNPSGRAATPGDIGRALRVLAAACILEAAIYAALMVAP